MSKIIIVHFVFIFFFNQPRDILCGAADEVLVVLKDDKMKVWSDYFWNVYYLLQ